MAAPSFIQIAEIWAPDPTGRWLELRSGAYGAIQDFRSVSEGMVFAKGQGLPGRVWETQRPIVLNHFRGGSGFLRSSAALRAGLVAGVGFPVSAPDGGIQVCVLLCGAPEGTGGLIEIWEPERAQNALGLTSGYHGELDSFRRLSGLLKFPKGVGLPGKIYESRMPLILEDLSDSGSFIRAAAAETFGLSFGFGLPIFDGSTLTAALVMLARRDMPLARVIEIWVPDAQDERLVLDSSAYQDADAMRLAASNLSYARGEGLPGLVWSTRAPLVLDDVPEEAQVRGDAFQRAKLSLGVGIPIIEDARVRAVVLLLS